MHETRPKRDLPVLDAAVALLGQRTHAVRLIGDTFRDATVRAAGRALAPAFGGVPVPELGRPLPEPGRWRLSSSDRSPDADLPIH